MQSVQEKYAPKSICFGCGPANTKGLRIRSLPAVEVPNLSPTLEKEREDIHLKATVDPNSDLVCQFRPEDFHEAFPGMINGGIIGALLDCHSNWTAAYHLMRANSLDEPPCTVTAEFTVKLLRPTPSGRTLELVASVAESRPDRATIEAKLICGEKVCATCRGIFVAVKPGHPAYHRWS